MQRCRSKGRTVEWLQLSRPPVLVTGEATGLDSTTAHGEAAGSMVALSSGKLQPTGADGGKTQGKR
jgi:hypothetical protein